MKSTIALFITVIFSCVSTYAQEESTITSAEITFNFESKDVNGSIAGFNSESKINLNNITQSKFKGSVSAETLKTGNFLRDWHLKGNKYFNVDKYPKIAFESTQVVEGKDGFTVIGTLTLKGVSKTMSIDFMKKESTLVGAATLFSSDFGITIKDEKADNEVSITMTLKLSP
ncbi:YceI family protein [Zobellia uliginosa]|uniref:YceI family protein n=1 Tax=Zobellia uliginosa TaxID=143224 RepID=UPI001C066681|nr:YceI family protein [Zobellia uliginosa]MBU2946612.1 YceI family protein [Zobellia uliginosa]